MIAHSRLNRFFSSECVPPADDCIDVERIYFDAEAATPIFSIAMTVEPLPRKTIENDVALCGAIHDRRLGPLKPL